MAELKNNQLFLVKMSGLILVAQNSVKRGLKLLFYHFQHRERFYNTYRYDQNLVKHQHFYLKYKNYFLYSHDLKNKDLIKQ